MKIKEITQIEYTPDEDFERQKPYNEYSVSVWTDIGHYFVVTGWDAFQIIKASRTSAGLWSQSTKNKMLYHLRSYILTRSGEKRATQLFTGT